MRCLTEKRAIARLLELAVHKTANEETHMCDKARVAVGAAVDLDAERSLDDVSDRLEHLRALDHDAHVMA